MNHARQRTYSLFTVSFTAFRRSSHHLSVRLLKPNPLARSPQSHFHTYWLRPSPTNRSIECLMTSWGEAPDVRGKKGKKKRCVTSLGADECFLSPVDLSAVPVGRRRGRIQGSYITLRAEQHWCLMSLSSRHWQVQQCSTNISQSLQGPKSMPPPSFQKKSADL